MDTLEISGADPHPRRTFTVLDSEMSFIDIGEGDPIVFLHGNPSSSYLWRNVIPHVAGLGRILAPDLVGFGRSGKSPSRAYRYTDHVRYLDAWFEALGLTQNVTLVLHDWGSALGFNRAVRFPEQIKTIAFMESIAMVRAWSDFGQAGDMFRALRSPKGEQMVLDDNFFVEKVLPMMTMRPLSEEKMAVYRAPFTLREDRLPTLALPRDIPIEGEPEDVAAIVDHYSKWLATSRVPKLFINAEPGMTITGRIRDFVRTWPNQQEMTVKGRHFVQEDSPHEIGRAIAHFVKQT
jgi:haloalkane dehalogenase